MLFKKNHLYLPQEKNHLLTSKIFAMRKNLLLLTLGLLALSASAQMMTSPWKGTALPETGGTYYLYNVESGLWLQNNRKVQDEWTTRAQVGLHGFDIKVIPIEGGFQLDPRFGHNHSINANLDQGYMDTGREVSTWSFVSLPPDGYDASNMYTIEAIDGAVLLGVDLGDDEMTTTLSYDPSCPNVSWQLVSKEERLAALANASEDNPMDATWLIDDWDFANQNERNASWKSTFGHNAYNQGYPANRAFESWNGSVGEFAQTITGLPDGRYGLTLQGYYRDGSTGGVGSKHVEGTEVIRAYYFANSVKHPLMSICENCVTEPIENVFPVEVEGGYFLPGDGGSALPNASNSFYLDFYWNEEIFVTVAGGTLKIGVGKDSGVGDDWTVFDNFKLTYYGAYVDIAELLADLGDLITEVDDFEGIKPGFLEQALAQANEALNSTDAAVIGKAFNNLNEKFTVVKAAQNDMKNFAATVVLCKQEAAAGSELAQVITNTQAIYDNATTTDEYAQALRTLQIARRVNAAEREDNYWAGHEPELGQKYYFYNVGEKRYLCGGDDWGAHAALGIPGIEIQLEEGNVAGFRFNTFLNNGGDSQYLNYGGYMDTGGNDWMFVEVGNGVYNIVRADDLTISLGYRPGTYCRVDTDMPDLADPRNQWILVTREDRYEHLSAATPSNPADASFLIGMPNFSQRENLEESGWYFGAGSIWGRGSNYPDFVYECYSTPDFDMNQLVTDLPLGNYEVSCQGYYRESNHEGQAAILAEGGEPLRAALLYANEGEVEMMNITDEADKAPGMGELGSAEYPHDYPKWVYEATNFFQCGLYKNAVNCTVDASGELFLGVIKDYESDADWVVVDNFRIKYFGDGTGIKDVINDKPVQNGKIYNLMGVEVTTPAEGTIYIRDGKKYMKK